MNVDTVDFDFANRGRFVDITTKSDAWRQLDAWKTPRRSVESIDLQTTGGRFRTRYTIGRELVASLATRMEAAGLRINNK